MVQVQSEGAKVLVDDAIQGPAVLAHLPMSNILKELSMSIYYVWINTCRNYIVLGGDFCNLPFRDFVVSAIINIQLRPDQVEEIATLVFNLL